MTLRGFFGRSWRKYCRAYLNMRNSSRGEILMAILEIRLMGMLGHMEISGLEKETVEGWHLWTLL